MTRALVWKELREQWAVWLALALAAAGAAAGLFALFSPGPGRDELLTAILWLTAWGYGLVCGALLLAGEAEGETQPFLDSLPASRWRVWWVKACAGLALLAAQVAALALIGFVLFRERYIYFRESTDLTGMLVCGAVGYAWGLYCGSSAASVLGAIARAVFLQVVAASFLCLAVALLFLFGTIDQTQQRAILPVIMGLIAAGAFVRSRAIYCLPDRLRATPANSPGGVRARAARWAGAVRQACREARGFAIGMAIYGVAGMAALVFLGAAGWPAVTLILGVLCGVTSLAGERGWFVRAGVRFVIGLAAAGMMTLVVLVPDLIHVEAESSPHVSIFRNEVDVSAVAVLTTNPALYLTFWLVEGFACGLLSGSLFRGRLFAAATGLLLAAFFGGLWLPSVYTGGGLHAWHLFAVPAIFLAATLLLARPRAGRLSAWRAAFVAGCALAAAGMTTLVALDYRAYEMPEVPDTIDVREFVSSLPTPEENAGGLLTSDALLRVEQLPRTLVITDDPRPPLPAPGRQPLPRKSFAGFINQTFEISNRGWKADDRELGLFLDTVFDDRWARDLARAAELPTGLLEDPRGRTLATPERGFFSAREAAALLVARGLQQEFAGKPDVFVSDLRTGLAMVRNLRHGTLSLGSLDGNAAEWFMAAGVERWLERLDGRPDLLRRALEVLRQHAESSQPDRERRRQMRFLVAFNSLEDPADVPREGNGADPFFAVALNDTPLLRLAWSTPGERIRLRRILQGLASNDPRSRQLARKLAPPLMLRALNPSDDLLQSVIDRNRAVNQFPSRVPVLQVALRLFQAEQGRPAEKLDELVPKYLPALPADPHDGQPFRYRISRGESLDWPPDGFQYEPGKTYEFRRVPAGEGILWSVGNDGHDDGGHVQEWSQSGPARRPKDRIFLVPLPPGRP